MADSLYLSLWFPSFEEPEILPRVVSVLRQFSFSARRPGVTFVAVHPVSWNEPTILEQRFQLGITPEQAAGVYYSAAWDGAGLAFFYTTLDDTKRPYRLWRHEMGSTGPDALVFEEPDARFNVYIDRSRSGEFLFLTVRSHTTTEVRWLPAKESDGAFQLFLPRTQDVEYYLEHQGP